MSVIKHVSNGRDDSDNVCSRHPRRVLAARQLCSICSFHVVPGDPQLSLVFAAVVDPGDVLVVQTHGHVGFPVRALTKLEVRG
ncbi:hypothetical protein [Mycobacterium uberis]|uniref:hypothetical protein n=1 Tax=Mycobacterium uberis TaxID=2162698 RepID=UPI001403F749|nr:hypothetical protein [Mycobacterium uberis]